MSHFFKIFLSIIGLDFRNLQELIGEVQLCYEIIFRIVSLEVYYK